MHVLIVEDDARMRRTLTHALEGEGHTVCSASTCTGAIKQLDLEKPDVVLLDILLGKNELSGFDVARLMREDPYWRTIPIIVLSVLTPAEVEKRAKTHAFESLKHVVLEKPLNLPALLKAMSELVQAPSSDRPR